MLKRKCKIKKTTAQLLGSTFIVEYKVYVPRGQVNTSFFNIYKILSETESYYLVEPIPLVEMQIVRNHLAKARGEQEWSFDFLYNADANKTWLALGATDEESLMREYSARFINIIQTREQDYINKMENRKALMAARHEQKKADKAEKEAAKLLELKAI